MNRGDLIANWDAVVALKDGLDIERYDSSLGWVPTDNVNCNWPHRVKPQPKLRPFTPQEAFDKLWGREVREKSDHTSVYRVYCTDEDGANFCGPPGSEWESLEHLLDYYEFTDGTPCGVRE